MPMWSLPRSLADLLACFRPCFTAPTFRVFQAMLCGLVAQPGLRTVTGMLAGHAWPGCGTTRGRTASSRPRAGRPIRSACWCAI